MKSNSFEVPSLEALASLSPLGLHRTQLIGPRIYILNVKSLCNLISTLDYLSLRFTSFPFTWNIKHFQISGSGRGVLNWNKKSCVGDLFHMSPLNTLNELWANLNQKWKSWKIPQVLLSFTPLKLANSCCVSISTILILFSHCEHQASSFGCEEMLSISKKGSM